MPEHLELFGSERGMPVIMTPRAIVPVSLEEVSEELGDPLIDRIINDFDGYLALRAQVHRDTIRKQRKKWRRM